MAWLTRSLSRRGTLPYQICAVLAFGIFYLWNLGYEISLRDVQYFNGWILTAGIAVMMLLTYRKKTVILPFGRVRSWLKLHYYLGFATIGVFVVHTRYQMPDAALEWLLWALFVLVALSGVVGGAMSKVIPPRFEAHGERILFERIAMHRAQLAKRAEEIVVQSIEHDNTSSIFDLYNEVLAEFFAGHRNTLAHLRSSKLPLIRLQGELDAIERYLDDQGKLLLDEMRAVVEAKNNLDFHYANGGALKLWLFFHIPATYALIVAIVVHILVAYAFTSGIA